MKRFTTEGMTLQFKFEEPSYISAEESTMDTMLIKFFNTTLYLNP